MNIDMLRRIADRIEAEPFRFDMGDFNNHVRACNSVHCIGGWADRIAWEDGIILPLGVILDLDGDGCDQLFYPNDAKWNVWQRYAERYDWNPNYWSTITAGKAVQFLRDLADGEVTL